jgi:hypothetical protein
MGVYLAGWCNEINPWADNTFVENRIGQKKKEN